MTREQVRAFLKAGADALKLQFDAGRLTEFNKVKDKKFPFIWVETLVPDSDFQTSGSMLIDSWSTVIHVALLDKTDSVQDEYEALVDQADYIAQQLIWQYNVNLMNSTVVSTTNQSLYKKIQLSGISRPPFIKKHADVLTGVALTFTLTTPNTTNVC